MEYEKKNLVYVLTKDISVKESFRSLQHQSKDISIHIITTRSDLDATNNLKMVFFDCSISKDLDDLLSEIRMIKEVVGHKPLLLLFDDKFHKDICTLYQQDIEYILEKPVQTELLMGLLYKNLNSLKDKTSILHNHGISLHVKSNFACFNNCTIFLTDIECFILYFLLTKKQSISLEVLKKQIEEELKHSVSDTYLRVNIYRLRKKFMEISNLNLIKSRYRRGYYIAI